jgi:hypothetical protein
MNIYASGWKKLILIVKMAGAQMMSVQTISSVGFEVPTAVVVGKVYNLCINKRNPNLFI